MADTKDTKPPEDSPEVLALKAEIERLKAGAATPLEGQISQAPIVVQMSTPMPGDPTPGLSEIKRGGDFLLQSPDPENPGKFKSVRTNAHGIDKNGNHHAVNPTGIPMSE